MNPGGDDRNEMFRRHHIDDRSIEAFLTGNGAADGLASLAPLAEELRSLSRGPVPVPSAALATMMAEGFSPGPDDLAAAGADSVAMPAQPAGRALSRRAKTAVGGLGLAAKAAFGISLAAASVTAAGAAGALPRPAQHVVATVIDAATPFSFPDRADHNADFGKKVSTDAHDGGVDGTTVSQDAKHNGDAHRPDAGKPDAPGAPGATGKPDDPGQDGRDRANTTPAAGHVPTTSPSGTPGHGGTSDGSTAPDAVATTTPAGSHPDGGDPSTSTDPAPTTPGDHGSTTVPEDHSSGRG